MSMSERVIWDDASVADPSAVRRARRDAAADLDTQLRRNGIAAGMMLTKPAGLEGALPSAQYESITSLSSLAEQPRTNPVMMRVAETDGVLHADFYDAASPDDRVSVEVRFTRIGDYVPLRQALDAIGSSNGYAGARFGHLRDMLQSSWRNAVSPVLAAPLVLGARDSETRAARQSAPDAHVERRETMDEEKSQGGERWPNVSFPAKFVTKIEPLANPKTGEQVHDKNGSPRFEATVRIPAGTSLNGHDLGGWMFKQPVSERANQAHLNGQRVNVSFRPTEDLHLFKYEGQGEGRHAVAGAPVIKASNLWKFCSAVAKHRDEYSAERREERASANPSLSQQRVEAFAAAGAERDAQAPVAEQER